MHAIGTFFGAVRRLLALMGFGQNPGVPRLPGLRSLVVVARFRNNWPMS